MKHRILVSPSIAVLTVLFSMGGFFWLEHQKNVAGWSPLIGTARIAIFPLALCSAFAVVNFLRRGR